MSGDAEVWGGREFEREMEPPTRDSLGPSEYNPGTLNRHTGTPTWRTVRNDVPLTDAFDANPGVNPIETFTADHRRRAGVQIALNRTGTQSDAQRENFAPRDSALYASGGYNPITPARSMRHFVPTRRGEEAMNVVGAERRLEPRAALESAREDPLRAGAHRKEADAAQGRASHRKERAGRDSLLKMSTWQGLHSLAPNDRVSAPTKRSAVRGDAPLSRWDSVPSGDVAQRVALHAHPWGERRAAEEVALSAYDSQTTGDGVRAVRTDTPRGALAPEDTFIGVHDSNAARAPQPAPPTRRAAAALVLGARRPPALRWTRSSRPTRSGARWVTGYLAARRARGGERGVARLHHRAPARPRGRARAPSPPTRRNSSGSGAPERAHPPPRRRAGSRRSGAGRVAPDAENAATASAVSGDGVRLGGADATLLYAERRERIRARASVRRPQRAPVEFHLASPRAATRTALDVALPLARAPPARGAAAIAQRPRRCPPAHLPFVVVDAHVPSGKARGRRHDRPASYPQVRAADPAVPYLSKEEGIRGEKVASATSFAHYTSTCEQRTECVRCKKKERDEVPVTFL